MIDVTADETNFNSLSLDDLIRARDLYHVHLMHKKNVVATAIGRYLIRVSDPWPKGTRTRTAERKDDATGASREPRTLLNSEVRRYSWPCVLVFVNQWVDRSKFGHGEVELEDVIPKALYLPDGRVVPVCIVLAPRDESAPGPIGTLAFPQNLIGGGYPILADVQGKEHIASIGCLVTDGHLVYALTNRHVAGAQGETIYTVANGRKVPIGRSSAKQLGRRSFEMVYDGWPGKDVFVNLDIGLIEVDDLNRWTAQVFGIGTMGPLASLGRENLSLRLIGAPVKAYGAASRLMHGQIHALFYRFKEVGGFEYVTDFLIGPSKEKPFSTHPGDSGTLWLLDQEEEAGPRPIAVQWGGHVFVDGGKKTELPFALATSLTSVCNLLDVELVRDWNIGLPEYWGAVGHYTIANKAIQVIRNKRLKKLMDANLERITYNQEQITSKNMKGLSTRDFVPLADVPDMVWKVGRFKRGGMSSPEHPNHFADMDKPGPDGRTLLEITEQSADPLDIDTWRAYYTSVKDQSRGLLPFRVWQIFQDMVQSIKDGQVARFVCGAGIISHYVGDACQPLHISYMFDGIPDDGDPTNKEGKGVHSAYEDGMVDRHTPEIAEAVDQRLSAGGTSSTSITTGHDAGAAVLKLMKQTFDTISPKDIVDQFVAVQGQTPSAIADALWEKFGADTIQVIADGSLCLAMLWDAAWEAGGGDRTIGAGDLGAIDEGVLSKLYQNPDFLPSHTIDTIGPLLSAGGVGPRPSGNHRKGTGSRSTSRPKRGRRHAPAS